MWYAGKDYSKYLAADLKVRKYLSTKLREAAISKIIIERPAKNAKITILFSASWDYHCKKGEDVETLRKQASQIMGVPVHLNIEEVSKPDLDARLYSGRGCATN